MSEMKTIYRKSTLIKILKNGLNGREIYSGREIILNKGEIGQLLEYRKSILAYKVLFPAGVVFVNREWLHDLHGRSNSLFKVILER